MAKMLIYVGKGAFIPDIPARDLDADEVKKYGGKAALKKTGLYADPPKKKSAKSETESEG
jgi:hypothetical protein